MSNPIDITKMHGIIPPIITPVDENENIDIPRLREHVNYIIEHGVDGILAFGSNSEFYMFSDDEMLEATEAIIEEAAGRVPVIFGLGHIRTKRAVALAKRAAELPIDAISVLHPMFIQPTEEALEHHFTAIANAVPDTFVFIYHNPGRCGYAMSNALISRLAHQVPNILGIKEASGDLGAVQRIRRLCPPDFYIWSGNDDETVPICALGGKGVISVAANVVPAQMHQLVELCLQNDFAAAGELQVALKPLCDALFCEVNPIPVKTALNLMGWEAGPLRLPLCQPSEEHLQLLQSTLAEYGLLPES